MGVLADTSHVRSHEWIDRRSLALHEAVARKLEVAPELLAVARANLERWLASGPVVALLEWRRLIDEQPIEQVVAVLRSDDESARRLRQSSPFAGILSTSERHAILQQYDAQRS